MPSIHRLYVEKTPEFAVEARHILHDLKENLRIESLKNVRLIIRYDVEGLSEQNLDAARFTVFAEAPVDVVFAEELPLASDEKAMAVEYLPGQYDQRSDSAAQCLQLLTHGVRPAVACAKVFVFKGALSEQEFQRDRKSVV